MTSEYIEKQILKFQKNCWEELVNITKIKHEESQPENYMGKEITIEEKNNFELDLTNIWNGKEITPVAIKKCCNFVINLSGGTKTIPQEMDIKRLITIEDSKNFELKNLKISGGRNQVTINKSKNFRISDILLKSARGYGLTIVRSSLGTIRDSVFINSLASGINIVGETHDISINKCKILECKGLYNWDAGINCMHCSPSIKLKDIPELCHEDIDIEEKTEVPYRILIEGSEIYLCNAQGIYVEGGANIVVKNCFIHDNNKEGICLDWGSMFSHIIHSKILRNGERHSASESSCKIDFLSYNHIDNKERHWCQLPGISIDNGFRNSISNNIITGNYGGGVKLVRSCIENVIKQNMIISNENKLNLFNKASLTFSENAYKIAPIMVTNAGVGKYGEFKSERINLDFLPSKRNLVVDNCVSLEDINTDIMTLNSDKK